MNHTPTPWFLDYGGGYGKSHIYSDAFPGDTMGKRHSLGAVHFPPLYEKGSFSKKAFAISDANAAFIVHAANNHEHLLVALRDADALLEMGDHKDWDKRREQIKKALRMAEAGKEKS